MDEINASNVPEAYSEAVWKMHVSGRAEETERGPVMAIPGPVFLRINRPRERVLFDPQRDANPYFHLMEAIWMLAGRQDAAWLTQFNKRMGEYAEPDGRIHGAYGCRWREHFHRDQLADVIRILRADPNSRRAVIGMWDPASDAKWGLNDRPCNTHIYVTIRSGFLEMTVCSRSNDLYWGMLGANVVHMTFLQEFLAESLKVYLGDYKVFCNNLHAYTAMPKYDELRVPPPAYDYYNSVSIVHPHCLAFDDPARFLNECELFVQGRFDKVEHPFFHQVAIPMYESWEAHKAGEDAFLALKNMVSHNDWKRAAMDWLLRREPAVQEPTPEPDTAEIPF